MRLVRLAARMQALQAGGRGSIPRRATRHQNVGKRLFRLVGGQEIAARLHFRGGLKQRLRRVTLRGDGDVPPALALRAGNARVGTVLYAARSGAPTWEALAVIDDACANTRLASAHAHDAELHSLSFP